MVRDLSGDEIDVLHYELLVKHIVAAAENLPPFPDIAWKTISLVKAMAPIKEIEEHISCDQAIAAKILRLGNSVYYGHQYEIRSLKEAILLLGNKQLIQVIIASCASLYYGRDSSQAERELWEHSVTTALTSEIVARKIHYDGILTLYTAALLHDIGNTVLNLYSKTYLQPSLREIRGESDTVNAERRAFGIDHQELGGIIARNWKFPPDIAAAIEHHHNPEKAGQNEEITSLVHLADLLAISFSKKNDKQRNEEIDPESDPIFRKFGITREMIDEFQDELETGMAGVMRALGTV
jgi:putative nucleotidyltransferase with HDIG domain